MRMEMVHLAPHRAYCEHCDANITYAIKLNTEHQMFCDWPDWCPECGEDPLEKSMPHVTMPRTPKPSKYREPVQLKFAFTKYFPFTYEPAPT